jgi:hypothetical protein
MGGFAKHSGVCREGNSLVSTLINPGESQWKGS